MTPERPVVLTPEAIADLADIWNHIADQSPRNADQIVKRLLGKCHKLRRWPFTGRPFTELGEGVRGLSIRPFIIFYRVLSDSVQVLHVFHGSRDLRTERFL